MDLSKLSEAMLQDGYTVQDLTPDDQYQRFEIQGHKGRPGYYLVRQSVSGLTAVYGDFVSGQKHRWASSNNSKALTQKEAEELKIILREKKLFQGRLSKDTGISESYLSYFMHGKLVLNKTQRVKIANVLGVPEKEIFNINKRAK
jgi:hypothetical protein